MSKLVTVCTADRPDAKPCSQAVHADADGRDKAQSRDDHAPLCLCVHSLASFSTIALIVASVRPAMAWTNWSPTISRANQPFKNGQWVRQVMCNGDLHAASPRIVFQRPDHPHAEARSPARCLKVNPSLCPVRRLEHCASGRGMPAPAGGSPRASAAISTTLRRPSSDLLKNDHFTVMRQQRRPVLNIGGQAERYGPWEPRI